jgi:hypothetical protein
MTKTLGTIAADFETQLAVKIAIGGTSGTLVSATDDDGVALPSGRYFFTIDKGNSKKEHISCSLSGTALTNIKSVSRQGVETTGVAREHRVGANVIISDFAHIKKINDLLDGTTSFDSGTPLGYDGAPSITTDNQFATKKYTDDGLALKVDDTQIDTDPTLAADSDTRIPSQKAIKEYADNLSFAGAPNASETVKGIVEIATDAQVAAGTDTGETGAKLVVLPSQLSSVNSKAYTAGEALTANNAVILASGSESAVVTAISTTNTAEDTTNGWWYQSFVTGPNTTKVVAITMRVNTGGGASSYTYRLRSTPAGSDLGSIGSGTINVGDSELTLTFASPVTVTPSTTYYIVVTGPRLRGGTTSSYSGGVSGTSSTSGASWVTPATTVTGDFYFKVFEGYCAAGNVYKASADSSLFVGAGWQTNFIGFAKTSVSSGASVGVQVGNVYTGFSGLTPGAVYYLSNTAGAIASSAGTVSKKVGLADSATSLLIKHDN